MFDFIKKKECSNCGKKTRKTINYAGYDICSESCMIGFFKNKTTNFFRYKESRIKYNLVILEYKIKKLEFLSKEKPFSKTES